MNSFLKKDFILIFLIGFIFLVVSSSPFTHSPIYLNPFAALLNASGFVGIAHTIPKYPDVESWETSFSTGSFGIGDVDTEPRAEIHFTSKDTPAEILNYYRKVMPDNGWKWAGFIESDKIDPLSDIINYFKVINGRKYETYIYLGRSMYYEGTNYEIRVREARY